MTLLLLLFLKHNLVRINGRLFLKIESSIKSYLYPTIQFVFDVKDFSFFTSIYSFWIFFKIFLKYASIIIVKQNILQEFSIYFLKINEGICSWLEKVGTKKKERSSFSKSGNREKREWRRNFVGRRRNIHIFWKRKKMSRKRLENFWRSRGVWWIQGEDKLYFSFLLFCLVKEKKDEWYMWLWVDASKVL